MKEYLEEVSSVLTAEGTGAEGVSEGEVARQ